MTSDGAPGTHFTAAKGVQPAVAGPIIHWALLPRMPRSVLPRLGLVSTRVINCALVAAILDCVQGRNDSFILTRELQARLCSKHTSRLVLGTSVTDRETARVGFSGAPPYHTTPNLHVDLATLAQSQNILSSTASEQAGPETPDVAPGPLSCDRTRGLTKTACPRLPLSRTSGSIAGVGAYQPWRR